MANEQNLKPLNTRTQRERKEIARKGAAMSNKVQANKKALREAANILLTMSVNKETEVELRQYKLTNNNYTYAMALVGAQFKKALKGDTKAFIAIRDIIGENPKDIAEERCIDDDKNIIIKVMPAS